MYILLKSNFNRTKQCFSKTLNDNMSRIYYAKNNFLTLKRHSSFDNFTFSFRGDSLQGPKKIYLAKLSTMTKANFIRSCCFVYIIEIYAVRKVIAECVGAVTCTR